MNPVPPGRMPAPAIHKGRLVFQEGGATYHIPIQLDAQELVDFVQAAEKRTGMSHMLRITPTNKVFKVPGL